MNSNVLILSITNTGFQIIRRLLLLVLLFVLCYSGIAQPDKLDLLQKAMSELKLEDQDLGFNVKTYWKRFPHQMPYKFPAFDNLYSNPLKLYDYTLHMAVEAESNLKNLETSKSNRALSNLLYALGIANHLTGFRGFVPEMSFSNKQSLTDLLAEYINDYPKEHKRKKVSIGRVQKLVDQIPITLHLPLTDLLTGLSESLFYHKQAIRNIDKSLMQSIFDQSNYTTIHDLNYQKYPVYEDVMTQIDEQSLYYSSMLVLRSCELFCDQLTALEDKDSTLNDFNVVIPTSLGDIIISGNSDDKYDISNSFLLIDLGGNDTYKGEVASTSINCPVSILIDLSGDDKYINASNTHATQGAGIFGTGILLDLQGDDEYVAENNAQGFGMFGLGLLFDSNGTDNYKMENSGQGCGYFGIGLNIDISGDDTFYIFGDGQGMAGVHGTGILCNYSGIDHYIAEIDPAKCEGRADYHSKGEVNANFAQGAGKGRRADLSDGHSWGGGLGALLDFKGDDKYSAGNFSQGVGYWFGTGILLDNDGDDTYKSVYFTQASAAHFAMGVLIDRKGNDSHLLQKTAGAALAFGWDFCNTLFVDESGDDTYEVERISLACSMIRSNSYFFELKGNDTYKTPADGKFYGTCDSIDTYKTPADGKFYGTCDIIDSYKTPDKSLFKYEAKQVGLFFELDGEDKYLQGDSVKGWNPNPRIGNNKQWSIPDSSGLYNNYYLGIDAVNGKIERFKNWEKVE